MATDIGKIFENQLQGALNKLKARHWIYWHRFPDTTSAGGSIIQNQPSDYLLGIPEGASIMAGTQQRTALFEAKASEKYATLPKAAVKPGQRGHIHRWAGLCNLPYQIIFWSQPAGVVEIWDGMGVVNAKSRLDKRFRLLVSEPLSKGPDIDDEKLCEVLAEFYSLPQGSEVVESYQQRGNFP